MRVNSLPLGHYWKRSSLKRVRAKKHLGQHFLLDNSIALDTVEAFGQERNFNKALEIGPGTGVLTNILIKREDIDLSVIDIDTESIHFLHHNNVLEESQIIEGDFLALNLNTLFSGEPFGVIGNFPYNISSQILFKILDYKDLVPEVVGMFQKEVAERICSQPGSKVYGIISVLLQAFYTTEYLFTIDEHVFAPPPKVKSAVIRLRRNTLEQLDCDEQKFKQVVKMAFNQRRKTLRNSLKSILNEELKAMEILNQRPEQLSVEQFIELTNHIYA